MLAKIEKLKTCTIDISDHGKKLNWVKAIKSVQWENSIDQRLTRQWPDRWKVSVDLGKMSTKTLNMLQNLITVKSCKHSISNQTK